jgi:L-malate glycosyltransferase
MGGQVRMPDYINLADGVLMPSEREGQSLVYLETQACGRVLIASDIPPAREIIVQGQTGLLFRLGDVADFAAKILMTARERRLRTTLALQLAPRPHRTPRTGSPPRTRDCCAGSRHPG